MTKTCNVCGERKQLSEFHVKRASKDGRNGRCKPCNYAVVEAWRKANPERALAQRRRWKKSNWDGEYGVKQKEVARAAYKVWRAQNAEPGATYRKIRAWRYGLTSVQYVELLDAQDGACLICGFMPEPNDKRLAVDHDHQTGKIRGLLCSKCNTGLGMLGDTPEQMAAALSYLLERG